MIDQITITSLSERGSIDIIRGDRRGYFLDDVDWGQLSGSHNTYQYYNQVGADIVSTVVGTRDISITGFVIEDQDTMETRCQFLNTFISPKEDYELLYKDKKITFRADSSITWSREFKYNNQWGRKFLIQGTCGFPLFQGAENIQQSFDSTVPMFHFPCDFGSDEALVYGTTTETYNIEVDNEGGFDTGLIAEIIFTAAVSNPKLVNTTTGEYIGVNYTFARDDVLRIETTSGKKSMILTRGETETNLIRYRDVGMSWIQLVPGTNQLSLECSDSTQLGGMTPYVYYTPLYQEVE